MTTLTLFYDARCGLCSSVRRWLSGQPAYVRLEFIP
jgi:predicted DCC family thiol-disulfide oxidoreductase YuxK